MLAFAVRRCLSLGENGGGDVEFVAQPAELFQQADNPLHVLLHLDEGLVAIFEVTHDGGGVEESFFLLDDRIQLGEFAVDGDDELRVLLDVGSLFGSALAKGAVTVGEVGIGLRLGGLGAPLGLLVGEADRAGDFFAQRAVGGGGFDAVVDLREDVVELSHLFALGTVEALEDPQRALDAGDHGVDGGLERAVLGLLFIHDGAGAGSEALGGVDGAGGDQRGGEEGGGVDDAFHGLSFRLIVLLVGGLLPYALIHAERWGFLSGR